MKNTTEVLVNIRHCADCGTITPKTENFCVKCYSGNITEKQYNLLGKFWTCYYCSKKEGAPKYFANILTFEHWCGCKAK